MFGELGKDVEKVGWGDRRFGEDEGRGDNGNGREQDGRGRATAGMGVRGGVGRGVIPRVVGAIEEILNDLLGGNDVDLIDIVDSRPGGDGESR